MTAAFEITDLFGRDILGASAREQEYLIERAFEYWRRSGFPYPATTREEAAHHLAWLQRLAPPRLSRGRYTHTSPVGLRVVSAFHPQIWSVKTRGRSPLDCFNEDERLRAALRKAPRFWPHLRCWNARAVRSLMRIYHKTAVSNFSPFLARAIVNQFSKNDGTVVDFSAGYGGRMFGTLSLPRHYVGIDPASLQVRGLRRMERTLRKFAPGTAVILHGPAEDLMCQLPSKSADLVFTSPPYFNRERYSSEPTQSYIRYRTYPEWRASFLEPVIAQSYRILKPGGYLAINVNDQPNAPLCSDTVQTALKAFQQRETIRLPLNRIPAQRTNGYYSWEPLLVFQKRMELNPGCVVVLCNASIVCR